MLNAVSEPFMLSVSILIVGMPRAVMYSVMMLKDMILASGTSYSAIN
jgi:hypothetical protein